MSGRLHDRGDGVEVDRALHVCAGSEVDPVDGTAQRCMRDACEPVHPRVENERVLVRRIHIRDQSRLHHERRWRSRVGHHVRRWERAGEDQQ